MIRYTRLYTTIQYITHDPLYTTIHDYTLHYVKYSIIPHNVYSVVQNILYLVYSTIHLQCILRGTIHTWYTQLYIYKVYSVVQYIPGIQNYTFTMYTPLYNTYLVYTTIHLQCILCCTVHTWYTQLYIYKVYSVVQYIPGIHNYTFTMYTLLYSTYLVYKTIHLQCILRFTVHTWYTQLYIYNVYSVVQYIPGIQNYTFTMYTPFYSTYLVYTTIHLQCILRCRSYENSISTKTSSLPDLSQNYIPVQDESYSQNVSFLK